MDEEILLSLTSSINKLGTSLRIQSERLFEFENMMTKDVNDAVTNLENSFESVLETSHSADDCLRKLKLVKKQNNIFRFLNIIRNTRHHSSSKLPFALTKNILSGENSGEIYRHSISIDEQIINPPAIIPLEITKYFEITSDYVKQGRYKQEHMDAILEELNLENFNKSINENGLQIVLDMSPILIASTHYLFSIINQNNLNLKLLDDADTYFSYFTSKKSLKLLKPKIYLSKESQN